VYTVPSQGSHLGNQRLFGNPPFEQLVSLANIVPSLPPQFDTAAAYLPHDEIFCFAAMFEYPPTTAAHLNSKSVRRILSARESIFKYGIYLPRNDRDADASPEKMRWRSGRQLEWLRLKAVGAFEYDWTKERGPTHDTDDVQFSSLNESQQNIDIPEELLPINPHFRQIGFTDAAFAVGELKFSISGFVIYVNGTHVIWGSYKQTSIADSTCAAEFVAAGVCAKQSTHVENMFRFLGFVCPNPYILYTDSQASQSIATNSIKMGKIRHIAIRYHLIRQMADCAW
jgi:hypothetical protein